MKTTRVSDNLTQLTRLKFVNAYLVREEDGFTLVDTTLPRSADALIAAAQAAGGEIRRIALTHAHGDHVGSVDGLRDKLGAAVEISMGETDARIVAGELERPSKGSWPKLKATIDRRLVPGDLVGSLEVVASPGHTPGHISFLDRRDRSLISGDVFASIGGLAVSNKPYWRFPLPAMATSDPAADLESARAMRALEPSLLALGHGPVLRAPAGEMDAAIARAG